LDGFGLIGCISVQGCQMAYFQTENPNLGKFCRALECKMLVYIFYGHLEYLTAILYILWSNGHVIIWYIFHRCGVLCQEKSGNPVSVAKLTADLAGRVTGYFR
jgi:hypothetical protein